MSNTGSKAFMNSAYRFTCGFAINWCTYSNLSTGFSRSPTDGVSRVCDSFALLFSFLRSAVSLAILATSACLNRYEVKSKAWLGGCSRL